MARLAIVYHSGFGHTAKVAEHVRRGAVTVAGVEVQLFAVEDVDWKVLDAADAIVFGAPTYMGSVSAAFKHFMDQTSRQWLKQRWQDKLAAGFTNSGGSPATSRACCCNCRPSRPSTACSGCPCR